MLKTEVTNWLREKNPEKLKTLWQMANNMRQENVGDEVHLRGLIEISNYCARACTYCGLNITNTLLDRYRMNAKEILNCAVQAVKFGYGTIVMQAGEDYGIETAWMAEIISKIKVETNLAVTLSLGERHYEDLKIWRQAGADRYLLRFETSDKKLYELIHPPLNQQKSDRITILKQLRQLGYEIGSGIMIGIPGQTLQSLADDIALFQKLDLDMIGVGPYIENPKAPIATMQFKPSTFPELQVPNTELMTYKIIALTRLVCPKANIPSTTALATLNKSSGRELGLTRGANVVMPNITPVKYREKYAIYPNKTCINETAAACQKCIINRIKAINRIPGKGPGGRI
jgi:biotin synthase